MTDVLLFNTWDKKALTEPLNLGYLAAVIRETGRTVKIIDPSAIDDFSLVHLQRLLDDEKPMVCGFGLFTIGLQNSYRMINFVKYHTKGKVKIVVGGPHATALPSDVLAECRNIDVLIKGEAESTIVKVLSDLKRGSHRTTKSVRVYQLGKQFVYVGGYVKDLDKIPFPARDLCFNYTGDNNYEKLPMAILITSRGCPFDCDFCSSKAIWGRTYRARSVSNIMSEVAELVKLGVKELFIIDDNFTLDKARLNRFCYAMHNLYGNSLPWKCLTRAELKLIPYLPLMKKAGCHTISIGIESGNQEVVDKIGKCLKLEDAVAVTNAAHKAGIDVEAFFMLGHMYDTEATMQDTLDFARELNADYPRCFPLMPYPGSKVYNAASHISQWWTLNANWRPRPMSLCGVEPERIAWFWHKFHDHCYSNPAYRKNIWRSFCQKPFGRKFRKKLINYVGGGVFKLHSRLKK